MGSKDDLQLLLEGILGSTHVYFQPPPTFRMTYPCIVFQLSDIDTIYANNYPYRSEKKYAVTVIDPDPDSLIPDKVMKLQKCSFERHFTFDNLNHDIFSLFY